MDTMDLYRASASNIGQLQITFLDEGFVKDGPQSRVQLLPHVLQENGAPKLDGIFQCS